MTSNTRTPDSAPTLSIVSDSLATDELDAKGLDALQLLAQQLLAQQLEAQQLETQQVETQRLNASLARLEEASVLVDQMAASLAPAQCELSVIIPVYNEPKTVLEIVDRVRRLAITKQIIVVNDGSTDDTAKSLEALERYKEVSVIHHPVNAGKGAALQTGFRLATGKIVIIQDADLEYDPSDILKVIEPLRDGSADVVYGSRYLAGAEQDPSRLHRLGNWLLTSFSNLLTGYRLTDMETCYKAFRRELLSQIEIEQKRFGFEPEITAKLARRRIRIAEVPVRYESRGWEEGKKIGIKDLFSTLFCIVRYSFKK